MHAKYNVYCMFKGHQKTTKLIHLEREVFLIILFVGSFVQIVIDVVFLRQIVWRNIYIYSLTQCQNNAFSKAKIILKPRVIHGKQTTTFCRTNISRLYKRKVTFYSSWCGCHF